MGDLSTMKPSLAPARIAAVVFSQTGQTCDTEDMRFLFKLIGNMVGLWLASVLVNGIDLPVSDGIPQTLLTLLVIGLVFTLLNMIVRPLLKFLTFPIYVLTLGIFALVVNALIFMLTGWMTQQIGFGLEVSGFWAALFGALVTAIVSAIIGGILDQTAN